MKIGGPWMFGGARSRKSPRSQASLDVAMLLSVAWTKATVASSTCCQETSWVATSWLAFESSIVQHGCVCSLVAALCAACAAAS